MTAKLLSKSASISDLKKLAKRRIPKFVFNYVESGCNSDLTLQLNRRGLDATFLRPDYMTPYQEPVLATEMLGKTYDIPFGVAPLGLTGLIWPNTSLFHARAAKAANIPFILSTLSTVSIEQAAEAAEENFWFQLYPPKDQQILDDLLARTKAVGCKNLVITIDVPVAARRPRDIRNGLAVPPKISAKTVFQSALRPHWSLATVAHGLPQFANLQPYVTDQKNLDDIANYIRTALKQAVDIEIIKRIRDKWDGNLIIKGITHATDAQQAIAAGADAIIVSNHGGRQHDATPSSISSLQSVIQEINKVTASQIPIMADSGVETGVDIARFLASGAQMVFAGRAFLYGVGAHGEIGAHHTIDILRDELKVIIAQLHCPNPQQLSEHLQLTDRN